MKKRTLIARLLLLCLLLFPLALFAACGEEEETVEVIDTPYKGTTLYVYNWGEYISDGSEGSLDVVKRFEETYGITVKYDYYDSNETMYAQLKPDSVYDIIIPSDYMIEKLIKENKLQKIDWEQIPNRGYIDPQYQGQYFDPADEYCVPYAVGKIGIVYNTKLVDEVLGDPSDDVLYEPAHTWELLWSDKFDEGQIINFNNPRDGFGVAQYAMSLSVNSEVPHEWEDAYRYLLEQKNHGCIYLMDEIFNKMENGSAAVATYYAGDCLTMMGVNEDLAFYYPEEGTNIFIDAMCIPIGAKNTGAAHLFINFMLDPEIATQNANYISYASPNTAVPSHPDYAYPVGSDEYTILYEMPESYVQQPERMQYYHDLPPETLQLMNDLWIQLSIEEEEGVTNFGTYVFLTLLICGIVALGIYYGRKWYYLIKKKKSLKGQ